MSHNKGNTNLLRGVVSQRVDNIDGRREVRDALDQRLVEWLLQVGVMSIPIPNLLHSYDKLLAFLGSVDAQVLVLSGGNDIGSCPERDDTELLMLRYAEELKLPVLGICRGMQMLAKYSGQDLVQISSHAGTRHPLVVVNSYLPFPSEVNSYHNWSINECPLGYEVTATAQDGSIEAIRNLTRPWEGWMWHPERDAPFDSSDVTRAKALFFEGG